MSQYIIQGIFVVAGIIALLGSHSGLGLVLHSPKHTVCRAKCRTQTGTLVLWHIRNATHWHVRILFPEYTANMTAEINRKLVVTRHFSSLSLCTKAMQE